MSSVQHEADPWVHEGLDIVFVVQFTAPKAGENKDPDRMSFRCD